MCKVWYPAAQFYWLAALAAGVRGDRRWYLRVARARGLGARVLPYVLTGVALTVLLTAASVLVRVYLAQPPADHVARPGCSCCSA